MGRTHKERGDESDDKPHDLLSWKFSLLRGGEARHIWQRSVNVCKVPGTIDELPQLFDVLRSERSGPSRRNVPHWPAFIY
jgi:hypothetical protein